MNEDIYAGLERSAIVLYNNHVRSHRRYLQLNAHNIFRFTMTPTNAPLLVIHNTHAVSCGEPPNLTNTDTSAYLGYFQGEHGDQWVFVYDRGTRQATIHGGDVRWDKPVKIASVQDVPYHFTDAERRWVEACWLVATEYQKSPLKAA